MIYAKLENGVLKQAPIEFVEDGKHIRGFTEEFLVERGYKPVMASNPPSESAEPEYIEDECCIYQEWRE